MERAYSLLHAQRHETQFAVGVGHQQQDGFLAILLELIDALLDVGGVAHRLLRHLDDHLAGAEPFLGGVGGTVDTGDDDALDAVLDLVAGAQILAEAGEIEAQRLLRDRLLHRLGLRLGRSLHRLLAILEAAEHDLLGFLRPLADDDDIDFLADRGVGHDARQVLWLLDVLAVELDHDIAGLDPAGFGGPLFSTPAVKAPRAGLMLRLSAISSVTCWIRTPSQPRRSSPNCRNESTTPATVLEGTAKPMPIEPPDGEMISVLTPITSPSRLNSGPPELPRLMAASV